MSFRVLSNAVEPLNIYATLSTGLPATGLTDLYIRIRRQSDGYYLDWADYTFKNAGWATLNKILTELDATNAAGMYATTLNLSSITNPSTDDYYLIYPIQTPGTSATLPAPNELAVGSWVDDIPEIKTRIG